MKLSTSFVDIKLQATFPEALNDILPSPSNKPAMK